MRTWSGSANAIFTIAVDRIVAARHMSPTAIHPSSTWNSDTRFVKKQPTSRRTPLPRTKSMLLPLSTEKVRSLSLENHLALAAIRSGRGNLDQVCCLLRVVYLAFYMRSGSADSAELEPYRNAECALDACIGRMESGGTCMLLSAEQEGVERILVLHDEQLATVSRSRYLEAWEKLQRFVGSGRRSPIPAGSTAGSCSSGR